ncbi:diacylglycerol/polyprenol kinase family protein [Teretinema zuelzerae]|uniref:diacylglycerol/polyprenol kinase family protein n=1 Tax=Teretinema zuelzerae TaxID=156 RepID=UPI001E567492|nr:diacylglycerol/polyprenol kinase family protein [Teretinema zuelzerae]
MGIIADFRYRKISHTATVNDLLKEFFRKSIHLCASLVPFIATLNYSFTLVSLSSVICLYTFCEYRRITGNPIPFISRVTAYASRKRDEGRFVLGPVTMALGVLFALILFPPQAARVAVYALAFGDGIASLAGKLYGRIKIPRAGGKTLEGSTACFIAVYVSTLAATHDPFKSFLVALLAMTIEVLPIKDYDNLVIPLAIGAVMTLLP